MSLAKFAIGILIGLNVSQTPALASTASDVEFVVGNNVWHPGTHYKSSAEWLALSCDQTGCQLQQASLRVQSKEMQGHYDEQATKGQMLTFHRPAQTGEVIAWFKRRSEISWLNEGKVTTYATRLQPPRRTNSTGTLELAVNLPEGKQALFVPLVDGDTLTLQIRTAEHRQLLGPLAGPCSAWLSISYFLWSGDLNRDGKADYLLGFAPADGNVVLYLASSTKNDAALARAGVYQLPLIDSACD